MKFLIDFDNAHSNGLVGINSLKKSDELYIFYSDNSMLSFDLHRSLEKAECKKYYQKTISDNNNSLDILLSTIFGNMVADDINSEYAIISRNNGYGVIINYWKGKGISINRFPSVSDAIESGKKEAEAVKTVDEKQPEESDTKKEINKLTEEINNLLNIRN